LGTAALLFVTAGSLPALLLAGVSARGIPHLARALFACALAFAILAINAVKDDARASSEFVSADLNAVTGADWDATAKIVVADYYMHNPRGSNNRSVRSRSASPKGAKTTKKSTDTTR